MVIVRISEVEKFTFEITCCIILICCVKAGTVRSVTGRWLEVQFACTEINFPRQLEDGLWGPPSLEHNEFKEIFHFWPLCCLRRH